MPHGTVAQERAKKLVVLTLCRAYVGEVVPCQADLATSFGMRGSSAQRIMHKLASRGLIDLRRVQVCGTRLSTGGNPSTARPITRLMIDRVCTDAEFAAAYPIPIKQPRALHPKQRQSGAMTRAKVLAIARLAHEKGRLLPRYGDMGLMIGYSAATAHSHLHDLIGDGVIKVRTVLRDDGARLRVVAVAP